MSLQRMQLNALGYYNHVSSADYVMKLKSRCQPQVNTARLHKIYASPFINVKGVSEHALCFLRDSHHLPLNML